MFSQILTFGLAATFFAASVPSPVSAAPARHYVFLDAPADDAYGWTVTNWQAQYSDDDALCSYSESLYVVLTTACQLLLAMFIC